MKKIAVVHYMPLEFYPPITNLLDVMTTSQLNVSVWTSENNKNRTPYRNNKLNQITRCSFPASKDNSLIRLLKYFWFNLTCFFGLIKYNPDVVIYYESYSVFPVYLYSLLFGKKKEFFIHYHEYESPKEYKKGMKLVQFYHRLEKRRLYRLASWISQTNQDRLSLFSKDHPTISKDKLHVMPNFPPKSWLTHVTNKQSVPNTPLKTVYVGSLSLKDTYIKEYCEWVMHQNGAVTLDIFAYNLHTDTQSYLRSLGSAYINFHEQGIAYQDLPKILSNFDVGVILYKGNTKNYVYNAPNKLFEYLMCNLTVIYPQVMRGIHPYKSSNVLSVDFLDMPQPEGLSVNYTPIGKINKSAYTAENAYKNFVQRIA